MVNTPKIRDVISESLCDCDGGRGPERFRKPEGTTGQPEPPPGEEEVPQPTGNTEGGGSSRDPDDTRIKNSHYHGHGRLGVRG